MAEIGSMNKTWAFIDAVNEDAFETEKYQKANWGERWGINNDYGKIKKVLMHRPGKELENVNRDYVYNQECDALVDSNGKGYWMGKEPLDIAKMQEEHDHLASILRREGAEVIYTDAEDYQTPGGENLTKLIFSRDPFIAIPGGAVIMKMNPLMRHGEERVYQSILAKIGMPICGMIRGNGTVEGGSVAMINPETAVVGISSRVNEEGADQLEAIFNAAGVRLIRTEMPGWLIHVDCGFVMLDRDVALINPNFLAWGFLQELKKLGVKTIEADPNEFWAVNVLAVAPGRVITTKGNERTAEAMVKNGIEIVDTIDFSEINRGNGSIHCSTQPIVREYE